MRLNFLEKIYLNRNWVSALHDGVMAGASFVLALYLRLGENFRYAADIIPMATFLFTVACVGVFVSMRLYRGVWRYASLMDLVAIVKAVTVAILVFLLVMFLFTRLEGIPRSVLLINWLLLLVMLGGPRFLYRIVRDRSLRIDFRHPQEKRVPVLLIGAGGSAELFLREAARSHESPYRVVGIVDNDKANFGRDIHQVRVYGDFDNVPAIVDKLTRKGMRPQKIVVSDEASDGVLIRKLLEVAEAKGLSIARMPRLSELRSGHSGSMEVRPIALEDLLGRAQNVLDKEAMRGFIERRRVMITGAGGSIGSELVRRVCEFAPQGVMLVDSSEFNLYSIDMEVASRFPVVQKMAVIGDVRNREHMAKLFAKFKPDIVFHAAALKHVPLCEDNPEEAALTNVLGTRNIAELACEHGASDMVLISTDKAVNPKSLMGATKKLAESFCQAFAPASKCETRFTTVRFGNVLGSAGSVVPLFRRQLEAGGPITITDPKMTRYFMTIREAVGLVVLASSLGARAGEKAAIYVLDMGEPVRIEDMARQMIKLAGLKPDEDIKIEYTGLRPGEKLYEELFHYEESPAKTQYGGIMKALARPCDYKEIKNIVDALEKACAVRQDGQVTSLIKESVKEYG